MTTSDILLPIRASLANLPAQEKESIMSELQAHLEDKADALRAQGHPDADAAAGAALGDPGAIGARLAEVHSRPTRRQTILAVLPFILTGLLPAIVFVVAAIDRAMGPAQQQLLRIFGLRLNHVETTAAFWLIVLGMMGLFALGGLWAMTRSLPSWSVAWVGSMLLDGILGIQIILDDAAETTVVLAMLAMLLGFMIALVAIGRWRGSLVTLLIGLSSLLQSGIFAAYLSTASLSHSLMGAALGMCLAAVGAMTVACTLHRRAGYWAAIALTIILSMTPYTLQLALTVDAATMAARMFYNLLLPSVLLLFIPYWLGRRQTARE